MTLVLLPPIVKNRRETGRLKNPTKPRTGETIGGGFFVVRRGSGTSRIRPAWHPFEHATFESAAQEARKLAGLNPGRQFDVLSVVSSFREVTDTPDLFWRPTAEEEVEACAFPPVAAGNTDCASGAAQ